MVSVHSEQWWWNVLGSMRCRVYWEKFICWGRWNHVLNLLDLNLKDSYGDFTALHILAINGNRLDGIRNLLDAGADPIMFGMPLPASFPSRSGFPGWISPWSCIAVGAVTKRKLMEELWVSRNNNLSCGERRKILAILLVCLSGPFSIFQSEVWY